MNGWLAKIVGALIVLVALGGLAYIAWKQFMPDMSEGYPSIEDMREAPGFIPKGRSQQDLPHLPSTRGEE
jgi:hypothetical protein